MKEEVTENYVRFLVSKNLKRIRSTQKISQLNLAVRSELTHNFINDIENGKKGISSRTLAKLCIALNVEPYQFYLPDDIDKMQMYIDDFNDSLQKVVRELTYKYLLPSEP